MASTAAVIQPTSALPFLPYPPFPLAVLHLSVSLPVFFLANMLSKIAACICGGHLITLAFVTVSQNPPCCFSRKNIENIHIYLGETPPSLLLAKCDTDAGALLHLRLIVWPNSPPLLHPSRLVSYL